MNYRLVLNTLAHRRAKRLDRGLTFWTQPGRDAHIVLCPDRPTAEVAEVVAKWRSHPHVTVCPAPVPVLSPQLGQRWTAVRNAAFEAFDATGHTAEWSSNWDDDWMLGPGWEALDAMLANPDIWAVHIISLFIWDVHENVNILQYHSNPLFGRYARGWRRDPRMTNQIMLPVETHLLRHPEAKVYAPFYLLDYGTISDAERRQMFNACANAGKQDRYTTKYIEPPALMPLAEILAKWPAPKDFEQFQLNYIRKYDL